MLVIPIPKRSRLDLDNGYMRERNSSTSYRAPFSVTRIFAESEMGNYGWATWRPSLPSYMQHRRVSNTLVCWRILQHFVLGWYNNGLMADRGGNPTRPIGLCRRFFPFHNSVLLFVTPIRNEKLRLKCGTLVRRVSENRAMLC